MALEKMNEYWYNLSLRYLTMRPHSVKELRNYLQRKKASENTIIPIIEKLKAQKFLNDMDFARWWIDQRTRFKPKGKRLITLELQQKGISREILDTVFEKDSDEIVPDEIKATILLEKKKAKFENLPKQELFQKAGAFLARRGFGMDAIIKSIDEVFKK